MSAPASSVRVRASLRVGARVGVRVCANHGARARVHVRVRASHCIGVRVGVRVRARHRANACVLVHAGSTLLYVRRHNVGQGSIMVKKVVSGLGALWVYGCLGVASVGGQPLNASELPVGEAYGRAAVEEVAALQAVADTTVAAPMGEMSKEEKHRRQDACVRDWESDMDWCKRSTKGERFRICKERASSRLANCMARID